MQEAINLNFIKKNKKEMKSNDLDSFLESDEYNDLINNELKRNLFYMVLFLNSAKIHNNLSLINKDLSLMIESITNENYLQNIHECYKKTLYNYLEQAYYLIKNKIVIDVECVSHINNFIEIITRMPYSNNKIKNDIIKCLKKIEELLVKSRKKVNNDNIKRYERYILNLDSYIKSNDIETKYHQPTHNNNNSSPSNIYNSFSLFNKCNQNIENSANNNDYNLNWDIYSKNVNGILNYKNEQINNYCNEEQMNEMNDLIDNIIIPKRNLSNYNNGKNNQINNQRNTFQNINDNNKQNLNRLMFDNRNLFNYRKNNNYNFFQENQ